MIGCHGNSRVLATRDALWFSLALLLVGLVQASPSFANGMGAEEARHLLARTTFGPTVPGIREFSALTREQGVARLLAQNRVEAKRTPPSWVAEPVTPFRLFRDASAEERRKIQEREIRQGIELRAWWVAEMLDSPTQLNERMTLFWHGHFTSSQQKVRMVQLLYRQNHLLRRHASGNFADLLHAIAKDPAMLIYLDVANNRRGQPNENFAREVMELFTLGEGHYREADIREAARAFTGWSIDPDSGDYLWRAPAHDSGEKTVLGKTGNFDGDAVLDILLSQPRTAEHIVEKLWREFISQKPDNTEVRRIAAAFRAARYDIKVALRELLGSRAFWAIDNRATLFKSPADLVVGTFRQFEIPVADATPLALLMAGLGQNLFSPPNVKGWPGGTRWINSSTLLARKQFIERVFTNEDGPSDMAVERGRLNDFAAAKGVARLTVET
ncbi:MAG: DUF1800 family protein, partial [Burkholderiales bacterium]